MSEVGRSILRGAREARSYARGDKTKGRAMVVHVPEMVDAKAIRGRLHMSQATFAETFGFSTATVRDWEQGRRRPEGPARVLLTVIDREPKAVQRALAGRK